MTHLPVEIVPDLVWVRPDLKGAVQAVPARAIARPSSPGRPMAAQCRVP